MAGLLGGLLAESQREDGSLFVGVEFDFPSGTWRIAGKGVSSASLGHYEARVKSFGTLARVPSDRRGSLVSPELSIQIDDTDLRFAKLLGTHERILNSAARLKVLSANISPVTYYTGRLYDWTRGSDFSWTLNVRPPDQALTQNFCRKVVSIANWPKAADDVRGAVGPIVLGRHDSSGMGIRTGALPTLAVKNDANPFYRAVSWGRCLEVSRVYKAGVLQATSAYSVIYVVAGGEPWTIVSFTTDPGEVTVDALGYDSVGDGTGTLIDKPTDTLKWLLVNLIFQENTSGLWFADSTAPVEAAAFDSVRDDIAMAQGAGGQPYRMSAYFNSATTGNDYLPKWAFGNRCHLLWTPDGKLKPKLARVLASGSYITSPVFREPSDVAEIELAYPAQDWVKRVFVRYGSQQGSDYIDSLEVADPLISVESSESLDLEAGPAFK